MNVVRLNTLNMQLSNKTGGTNQGFYHAVVFYLSPVDSRMWMQHELISFQDIKQFSSSFTVAFWDSQAKHIHMCFRLTLSISN